MAAATPKITAATARPAKRQRKTKKGPIYKGVFVRVKGTVFGGECEDIEWCVGQVVGRKKEKWRVRFCDIVPSMFEHELVNGVVEGTGHVVRDIYRKCSLCGEVVLDCDCDSDCGYIKLLS